MKILNLSVFSAIVISLCSTSAYGALPNFKIYNNSFKKTGVLCLMNKKTQDLTICNELLKPKEEWVSHDYTDKINYHVYHKTKGTAPSGTYLGRIVMSLQERGGFIENKVKMKCNHKGFSETHEAHKLKKVDYTHAARKKKHSTKNKLCHINIRVSRVQ